MGRESYFLRVFSVFILLVSLSFTVLAIDAQTLLKESVDNVAKLETISLEIEVEISAEGLNQKMGMRLESHLQQEVGRLEFLAPKEFAGQIIIVDKPKDIFINYYSTGQAVRMPLSQSAQSNAMSFDVSKLMELNTSDLADLDASRYMFEVEETEKDKTAAYLVIITDSKKEYGVQKVWLQKSDKFPIAMEAYDNEGNKTMSMSFNKVEKNKNLDLDKLRTLPKGAVIFDM